MLEIPQSRPLTVADLAEMPDDGHHYELIDGMLHVTPPPVYDHQYALGRLYKLLDHVCPPELRVLPAPFAVRPDDTNEYQPDVLVFRREDVTRTHLPVAPLLAVEVLSPSTQLYDRNLKAAAYARMGVPSYWLVNPNPAKPAVEIWQLVDGSYKTVLKAVDDELVTVTEPYPVTFRPVDLVDHRS